MQLESLIESRFIPLDDPEATTAIAAAIAGGTLIQHHRAPSTIILSGFQIAGGEAVLAQVAGADEWVRLS